MLRQGLLKIVDALLQPLVIEPFGTPTDAVPLRVGDQQA